jgi:hypothetical protein
MFGAKRNRKQTESHPKEDCLVKYYFVGCFELSPFVSMPVSLLPKVMELIKGNSRYCQSAIFRVLRNIPDLCSFVRKKHDADISKMSTSTGCKQKQIDD